jgi:hypothetical protein
MYKVKIDYSIELEDITKELIHNNINVRGCLDQNFYKKLSFEFSSKDAYNIYYEQVLNKCRCGKDAIFMSFTRGYRKTCSKECSNKNPERMKKAVQTCRNNDTYSKGIIKMIETKEAKYEGYNIFNSDKELYYSLVGKYTNKQNILDLKNLDKRGKYSDNKDAYHLDHMYSKHYGFEHHILPFIIGDICNLQMLPALENSGAKNKQCSITMEELFEKFYKL